MLDSASFVALPAVGSLGSVKWVIPDLKTSIHNPTGACSPIAPVLRFRREFGGLIAVDRHRDHDA